ncbi:MAG: hypothetical protein Q8P24_11520 [Desulfobacterales bacterium]|nr:hypothetical protein [Desulfobacterales bacterium]
MRYILSILVMITLIMVSIFFTPKIAAAEAKPDMGGWEIDGAYNKHFNIAELEDFKGVVNKIMEVVPLPGMSPGVALVVQNKRDKQEYLVHLCPVWFAAPDDIGIRKGDRVTVRGVLVEIEGKEVFMATKVKKGDSFQFKVRLTKDGTPFWTMSPEQLARERK